MKNCLSKLISLAVCHASLSLSGQELPRMDSIHVNFEFVVKEFIRDFYSLDVQERIFYSSNSYPYLIKAYAADGSYYRLQHFYPKDSVGRDVFYRELPYETYINFVLSSTSASRCVFEGLDDGYWLYVSCPIENWLQFYFDNLIFNDRALVTPILDVIKVNGENITHERRLIVCSYIAGKGFNITAFYSIRQEQIVCP